MVGKRHGVALVALFSGVDVRECVFVVFVLLLVFVCLFVCCLFVVCLCCFVCGVCVVVVFSVFLCCFVVLLLSFVFELGCKGWVCLVVQ